ncbi:MAG: redoxin domain-containing protein [Pirellulaceae bacterium]
MLLPSHLLRPNFSAWPTAPRWRSLTLALTVYLGSLVFCLPLQVAFAADPEAGHSNHGEAFNEGPRQAAYLMPGMSNVEFEATTTSNVAKRFIHQGVAQLHGFWYYEAERSFRQAAVLDPDCATAYWGMAMANSGNLDRARGFIAEAMSRKDSASEREQLFIEAYDQYCKEEDDEGKKIEKKERAQRYTRDLESIVEEYPDDIEAKAFLALQCWQNARADLPIVSYVAVNSILQDIFDVNPNHPAHHYRIHLWDRHKAKRALHSAAMAGPSLPGVAHMWHMPGHIYDKLHRFADAAWQQEASARVDHAHMMRDRVLPDQIHNFAHNNEWLIRSLLKIGRLKDALALAQNMLELPRHPKYNTLDKRGSTKYGRERLLLALTSYRLWPELLEFSDTMYLEPTNQPKYQIERLRYAGIAKALSDDLEGAEQIEADLQTRLEETTAELDALEAEAKEDEEIEAAIKEGKAEAKASKKAVANRERRKKERKSRTKELKTLKKELEKSVQSVLACTQAANEDYESALENWKDSKLSDNLLKAEWLFKADKNKECFELLNKEIEDKPGQLLPLATLAYLQFEAEKETESLKTFEKVRELASQADIDTPLLHRLRPLADAAECDEDWRAPYVPADDIGERPDFDSLGSFRWRPYMAPNFQVTRSDGETVQLADFKGKPTLVIFYLGFGCLHCIEQLHAFSPRAQDFRESGIDVIAISTEERESLLEALGDYSKPLDIPLHADPELTSFKAYRSYDDFEEQPLHGTYLIDPDGRVLWQDISYEPFMDVEFTMRESHRLLKLSGFGDLLKAPKPRKYVVTTPLQ